MVFGFLHMADVHLDTPFQNRDPRIRALLRDVVRQAFENGVKLALAKKVHAVLIAGDLSGTASAWKTVLTCSRILPASVRFSFLPVTGG